MGEGHTIPGLRVDREIQKGEAGGYAKDFFIGRARTTIYAR